MPPMTHFTDPSEHPLTADLVARLESAEREIRTLQTQVRSMEALSREVRPRPDADLTKLSDQLSARVVATEGRLDRVPDSIVGEPTILHHSKHLGMKLYAYSRVHREEPLYVVLHGAMVSGTWFPRFERVRTMSEEGKSFCAVADPTIQQDYGLKLGWYVGHDGIDPNEWIVALIERLQQIATPRQLIFVGSSGGGYAALQLSRQFPDSLAFVMDPQTIIPNYHATQVKRLLRVGFDDISIESALEAYPERLSTVETYTQSSPENWVYYTQHRWDKFHIENHLRPFAQLFGVTNLTVDCEIARFKLAVVDRGRHGPLSPPLFAEHLAAATAWHAEKLKTGSTHIDASAERAKVRSISP